MTLLMNYASMMLRFSLIARPAHVGMPMAALVSSIFYSHILLVQQRCSPDIFQIPFLIETVDMNKLLSPKETGDEATHFIDFALSRRICLVIFSILLIPAILLSLLIFYWIFRIPEIRNRLTNQLIIAIFVTCFIQVDSFHHR